MALVATVGAKTANSYVSQSDADTYFGDHPLTATWTALTSAQQDQYLIQATSDIEMEALQGLKYDDDIDTDGLPKQALHFPRTVDVSSTAVLYVPIAVKKACYEQAIALSRTGVGGLRAQLQAEGVTSATIGDVSETYGNAGGGAGSSLRLVPRSILIAAGLIEMSGAWA